MPRGYTPSETEYQATEPRHAGKKGVLLQRTKTIKAGDALEAEIYPVIDWAYMRQAKRGKTTEQMERANIRTARKRLARLINANFGPGDLLAHLTMAELCTEGDMRRAVRNFMRRLARAMRKKGGKLKYIYVIEETGEGDKRRHHLHMVLNGGILSRDEVEALWSKGLARVDRAQRQEKGLTGFAMYITQRKRTQEKLLKRRWACSKGLKQPTVTVSSSKFSRGRAAALGKAVEIDARKIFEQKYPGYRLIEYSVRYGEFLPGVYITAYMERIR